ncbi:MAG: TRAP transporter TatT component family protein, partial [Deltaproteobacteria bacterium]
CHFWTGINKALYGESVGILKMLTSLSKIEEHLKKTAEIDPGYAEAGAWRVLGVINQKVPSIFGGSRNEAIKDFRKAIHLVPREPMNYLFLARVLMDDEESKPEALKVTRAAIQQPVPSYEYVESLEARREVEELNRELESQTGPQ